MTIADKLASMNITLPPAPKSVGAYVPTVIVGGLIYTSGQLPMRDGQLLATGRVPTEVTVPLATQAARQAALNALSAIAEAVGGLDNVARIIRVNVFVNSADGFADQAKVANGASELLIEIFGQAGLHTRCAVGAAELPLNAPVEVDIVAQLK